MLSPQFEIVTTRTGAVSIRDNISQEIMHNPVGPWLEANSLYIEQSQLVRRFGEHLDRELVIFDVGLGAAANALATLHCARGMKLRRPLRLISFERNLDLLRFALEHSNQFEHFKGFEAAIQAILDHGRWEEDGIVWELRHGDFLQMIGEEPAMANLIFYDPYSYKKNADMWSTAAFAKVRSRCLSSADEGGILFTYSRATPIRVAMLCAGFFVGQGTATGAKEETTQAASRLEDLQDPLGISWLGRWERSHNPNAAGAAPEQLATTRAFIQSHIQFTVK